MHQDLYALAEQLRDTYGTSDPLTLAEATGVHVRFADLGSTKGLYCMTQGCRFILVNDALDDNMQELIILHELGHDLLHRDLAENSMLRELSFYDMKSKPERDANVFAANVLLTDACILDTLEEDMTTSALAQTLCVPHQILLIKLLDMNERGYHFPVPYIPHADFLGT